MLVRNGWDIVEGRDAEVVFVYLLLLPLLLLLVALMLVEVVLENALVGWVVKGEKTTVRVEGDGDGHGEAGVKPEEDV